MQETLWTNRRIQRRKYWEFSLKKSNWMCQKYSRTEEVEDIAVNVQQGQIKKASEYEYLGNWVNEKGNIDRQVQKMEKRSQDVIRVCNTMCSKAKVGRMEFIAKKLIYESLIIKTVYHNIEAWTNLRKTDKEKLETIQGKILRGIYGLPKSTPYWGMLYELDILPINLLLTYMKLMLYHTLINSDDDRTAKDIVIQQETLEHEHCWYGNVKLEAENVGIEIDRERLKGMRKSTWKGLVKKKIRATFQQQFKAKRKGMAKLRFLDTQATETYLKELSNEEARMALIIRLNMFETFTHNFGNRKNCSLCGHENDTTEHAFECRERNNMEVTIEDLKQGKKMDEIVKMCEDLENQRKDLLIDSIITNFNVILREEWEETRQIAQIE
jgi:hypothetical protein